MKTTKTVRALTRPNGRMPGNPVGVASRTLAARAARTAARNYEDARSAAARRDLIREQTALNSTLA